LATSSGGSTPAYQAAASSATSAGKTTKSALLLLPLSLVTIFTSILLRSHKSAPQSSSDPEIQKSQTTELNFDL
jgi:hypothetical protein